MSIELHQVSVTAGIAAHTRPVAHFLCRFDRGTRWYRGKAAQRARLAQALVSCADNWLEADSARSHLEQSSQVEVEWQPHSTLSGEAVAILLKAIARVPAKGGQDPRFICVAPQL